MVDLSHSFEPLALPRPRGAHRYDVFSPKLGRRLTLYRRSAFDVWLMIESDPAVQTFCERPGHIAVDGQRFVVDFWARYGDRECLVLLSESTPAIERLRNFPDFDPKAITVRRIDAAERAAARVWTGNWQRMLPVLVVARGLVKPSMLDAIERFVASPQSLLSIEREFSTGDPVLVRAAAFELLHRGRIQALELYTETLSLLTRFAAVQAGL
ncbi:MULTISPECIES: hypothetical protein [Paraburkholderia]|uniref:Uncharacterized protein n=1 Tax=Paraburkholderia dipogonis TaxID=1211383 RepID=A0A4Y8MH46_9BURK|nr:MULTISPECIES: hypothetical protein [Paraburkholderia]RKR31253.1 hypothetical protein B0G82_7388 [Paraburkholderia sp. BL17N1]TFE36769.1 hypothetical protein E2553_44765 [Paraburkholderia dipogonis]